LTPFKSGAFGSITDDGKWIEMLTRASRRALHRLRLLPAVPRDRHDSPHKQILALQIDSGNDS
jgi:hypothetical protein